MQLSDIILEQSKEEKKKLFSYLRKAKMPEDWQEFVEGYVRRGGKVTKDNRYSSQAWNFYVAKKNFTMLPIEGNKAINIIVPRNVKVRNPNNKGDNEIFYIKGFKATGKVPLFSDMELE